MTSVSSLVMAVFLCLLAACLGFFLYNSRKYRNPYKLTFIFGKKGAGKSCYMVKQMLRYQRKGWIIYTDMKDIRIPNVRIIDSRDLAQFRPAEGSAIFLDEVGITMDNRNFKSFPPGLRDFFKYVRKMKCVVFMNSQAYDVDKKVRDTTDRMILQIAVGNVISISRPIRRSVTLTESTAQADSRIADNLRFTGFWSWEFFWMPNYFKYFDSLEMPKRSLIPYTLPEHADYAVYNGKLHQAHMAVKGVYVHARNKVQDYLHF